MVTNGIDLRTDKTAGIQTGRIESYDAFVEAVKKQIAFMAGRVMDYVCKIEGHYKEINPDPILSAMYEHSVQKGVDVYEGGAKYNNSSAYFYSIASLVDSMAAVKRFNFMKEEFDNIYCIASESQKAFVKAIYGEIPIVGKSPVDIEPKRRYVYC